MMHGLWNRSALPVFTLVAYCSFASATPADLEVCAGCHGADGSGAGFDSVPILAGTPASHLEEALYAYQDGARRCVEEPLMCELAASLSEADIEELADYFAAMKRIFAGESPDAALVQAGERIHAERCAKCHVLPGAEDVENALGIPLHGQRSAYLRMALKAYLDGERETLVPRMAEQLAQLDAEDVRALVNYYSSYQP
jgi:cytochrome c553